MSGLKRGLIALAATGVVLLAACSSTSGPHKPRPQVVTERSQTAAFIHSGPGVLRAVVTAPVHALTVNGQVGGISVVGGSRTSVTITARLKYRGHPPVLHASVTSGNLVVSYRCAARSACKVMFGLLVPRALVVDARIGVGGIEVTGLTGPVTAVSGTGSVVGNGLRSSNATLITKLGTIAVVFAQPPERVLARDDLGAITISVPGSGPYHVVARTQLGDVHVSVPQSSRAARTITAISDLGAVTIKG